MISREAVLKAVYDALTYADSGELDRSQAEFVQKRILALPAVQPDAALAMRIAVEMEAHAALGTTTKAKADAILALIDKPGKEVMPDVEDTHHARPDTAPAGLSAGGGADYRTARQAIQKMLRWQGEYYVQRESADLALAFLDDMEAKNCPAPRVLLDSGIAVLTWVIGGWKLYQYCDEEETQAFRWQGQPATEGGA